MAHTIVMNKRVFHLKYESETRGPWVTSHTWEIVPINKHICAKRWLYHNVDQKIKKISSPFLINSRMLCALLGWPWPSGSMEKKISIKFCWCIFATLYFVIISLWKKGALQLNKPESLSHKDTLCHIWMKLAHWFWRRFLSMFYFLLFFLTHCGKR